MIRSFRHKGLAELWETGKSGKVDARMHRRLTLRLDRLNTVTAPEQMNVAGFDFHALRGFSPTRYTVHINGPWCLTFSFENGEAVELDFEQYH